MDKMIRDIPDEDAQLLENKARTHKQSVEERIRWLIRQDVKDWKHIPIFAAYKRPIDDGQGEQVIWAVDGYIVKQYLRSKHQGSPYTGPGNPEWIGKMVAGYGSQGFTKLRGRALEHEEEQYHIEVQDDYQY